MQTFHKFVEEIAWKGAVVNMHFEKRIFELVDMLHRFSQPLRHAGIPHELVGGLAVYLYVEEVDPKAGALTRDVDVMVRREDLERIIEAAASSGFRYRHAAGLDMLMYGDSVRAADAVHLLFAGERAKPTQTTLNPDLNPVHKVIEGLNVYVVPVADLLTMKLGANRDKDRVHVRGLDATGLITPEMADALPAELRARLDNIRATE